MTEEQRDELLLSISKDMKQKEKLLLSINAKLDEHTAKLDEHTAKLDEHTAKLNEHSKELVRQRQIMMRMENDIMDKIAALFDAREVNSDKFKQHDEELESINHTLERHNRQILELKSIAN